MAKIRSYADIWYVSSLNLKISRRFRDVEEFSSDGKVRLSLKASFFPSHIALSDQMHGYPVALDLFLLILGLFLALDVEVIGKMSKFTLPTDQRERREMVARGRWYSATTSDP